MKTGTALGVAGAFALAALAAAGCSGPASTPAAAPSPAVPAAANPTRATACSGPAARTSRWHGSPSQSCAQWKQNLAGTGLNWYTLTAMAVPGSQAADGSGLYQVACDLASGGTELFVLDTGGMSYGPATAGLLPWPTVVVTAPIQSYSR